MITEITSLVQASRCLPVRRSLVAALMLLSLASPAQAGLDDAEDAYRRGKFTEAMREYKLQADRGFTEANFMIAIMYANGEGVPKNPALAIEHATIAANAGEVAAIALIASIYDNERSGLTDAAKAAEWYQKGVKLRDTNSMRLLGTRYLNGIGVPKDGAKALELITAAARRDDVLAMYELGKMYELGQGVPKDEDKARTWYTNMRQAPPGLVRVKQPLLYVRLASLKERNPRGSNDLYDAASLFEDAANAGDVESRYRLGKMYEEGRGVKRDYARAASLYQSAADSGNANAMYRGGLLLHSGNGVPQNKAEAMNWFMDAATSGHAPAMRALGRSYAAGVTGVKDHDTALSWHCKAALADKDILAALATRNHANDAAAGKALVPQLAVLHRCAATSGALSSPAKALNAALAKAMSPAQLADAEALALTLQHDNQLGALAEPD